MDPAIKARIRPQSNPARVDCAVLTRFTSSLATATRVDFGFVQRLGPDKALCPARRGPANRPA